jgi:AMP nucleosidase
VWEHDQAFLEHLHELTALAIDMETATLFIVGHANQISRGALLLVSDVPITPEGVKTEESDQAVTRDWTDVHLDLGIRAMTEIAEQGEPIKHFTF